MDGESISQRIKRYRKNSGLTQQQVGDAIGISRVAVSKWESGDTKNMKRANLIGMSKLFGVSLNELLGHQIQAIEATAEKPRPLSTARHLGTAPISNTSPIALSGARVPLLSTVPAGDWREIIDAYAAGGADEYVMATEDVGRHGFALTVMGDSMTPDFNAGDTIFINPDLTPNPGDFVVARNHKLEATFKRYRPRGMNERGEEYYELIPLNENHPKLRSDMLSIEIIGVVVEHRRKLR